MNNLDNNEKVLTRGVEQILPSKDGLARLMRSKKITLYQGFDPSSPKLHIGNLIGIRKLAQFQKLGHKVIFLIGDFTGMIGDPTDKEATRKRLTHKEVIKNAKDYQKQIKNILKFDGPNAAQIKYNSNWLAKLTFEEIIELSSNFTVQQLIERDFFQERIKKGKAIHLHEFLYPLMQAYDSVYMDVDLEIGGNDQLFNMLAGRNLMKTLKNKEKYVLTMKLLTDPSGKKMGKTEGNTINLTDSPEDMFGKIMAMPDKLIKVATELLTDLDLNSNIFEDPLLAKKTLAFEVVKQIRGNEIAQKALKYFEKTFQKKSPDFNREIELQKDLVTTISQTLDSISKAKRLIKEGAVDVDGKVIINPKYKLSGGEKIKIGKKIFFKVKK
jgi:tyrosyl-tRNA synthetase